MTVAGVVGDQSVVLPVVHIKGFVLKTSSVFYRGTSPSPGGGADVMVKSLPPTSPKASGLPVLGSFDKKPFESL